MTEFTIREGQLSDVVPIARFQQQMALETENKELSETLIIAGVKAVFKEGQGDRKGFYVVAESENNVIGSLLVTYEWSDWRNGWFWWIQSVYVHHKWRQKGVYTALHKSVQDRSKKSGDSCGIRLYVEKENTIAQQVYQKMGMYETEYFLYEIDYSV